MDNRSLAPRLLSLQLLKEITSDFSKDRIVGVGSYGNVYKGEHTNGEMIAVKVLNYIPGVDDEQFEKEYHNLASLQHKNIVRLVGYCHETHREFVPYNGKEVLAETTKRALCLEYMQNGSLDRFLSDESTGLDWHTRYKIIKGICQGLKYLHEEIDSPMYHLDLKPANVLLDEKMVPKIADFGLSRLFGGEKTQITKSAIGTHGYVPPEYIEAAIISIKFDIYSLGVVIIKIMTGPRGYFRSAEMLPQKFIELVQANWKKRLRTTSGYTLDRDSEQVKRCIEIALSCIDADRHKRPSIGVIMNMLNETEIAIVDVYATEPLPGRVQLVMKSNEEAPFHKYNKKVILKFTAGALSSDRPGLDLVAVVDVSGSISGEKMDQLKTAMRFVVWKLSPIDRLSIVTFSDAATKHCPLRRMTDTSHRDFLELIDGLFAYGKDSNIKDGLLTGLKVLADRSVRSGRVAAIMLMSDGQQSSGNAARVDLGNVPVYTFGFGGDSDSVVLNAIAAKSMGGTFSHVKHIGGGGLTMAISQCLAGLLTVVALSLQLTVAPVGNESTIARVTAGSYPQIHHHGCVTIKLGNLYSREVRNIVVDLLLPKIDTERSAEILHVSYEYGRSSDGRISCSNPPETLTVRRIRSVEFLEELKPEELKTEEDRLQVVRMINKVRTMADWWQLASAQKKLVEAQKLTLSNPMLRTDLQELLDLLVTPKIYKGFGRAYALSSKTSHNRQRFSARGGDIEVMRLFATPCMDMYLEQAKKFLSEPTIPLPSVDDDVKEDVGSLMINVAAREAQLLRLSLETED